jgi:hypothetical protein
LGATGRYLALDEEPIEEFYDLLFVIMNLRRLSNSFAACIVEHGI